MKIKTIEFKNFKSYGNNITSIDFTNTSTNINLLIGKNGCGKSSLGEAIVYSLYGKASNIKLGDLVNRINRNLWCRINIVCDNHNIIVERGISPNLFNVTIDGEDLDVSDAKKAQLLLETQYYKIPYSVFNNLIILNIDDFKSLLNISSKDRKLIIDKIFHFDLINQINDVAKQRRKTLLDSINSYDAELGGLRNTVDSINNTFLKESSFSKEDKENIKKSIEDLNKQSDEFKEKLDKLINGQKTLNKDINNSNVTYNSKIATINSNISKIKELSQHICPICGSHMDSSETVHNHKMKLEEDNKTIALEAKDLKEKLSKDKEKLDKITEGINKIQNKIFEIQNDINKNSIDLNYYNNSNLNNNLNEIKSKIETLNLERGEAMNNFDFYDEIINNFSDNVKKDIASRYVKALNTYINDSLSTIKLPYKIKFDSSFDVCITYMNDEIQYETLSTGERKKIDFATIVGFIRIIKQQVPDLNLVFLDEIFSSVDVTGVDSLVSILKELTENLNLNIFVIHHSNLDSNLFDRVYTISKESGFSIIDSNEE